MTHAMKATAAAGALALGLVLTAGGAAQADTRHATTGPAAHVAVQASAGELTAQESRHARAGDGHDGGRNHQPRHRHEGRECPSCAG